jgi:hypothetical protein
LTVLQNLLGKRLITKAEFLAKRKRILETLWSNWVMST